MSQEELNSTSSQVQSTAATNELNNVPNIVEEHEPTQPIATDGGRRKRKVAGEFSDSRSTIWQYFDKFIDEKTLKQKDRCKYCSKPLVADTGNAGTGALHNHARSCKHIISLRSEGNVHIDQMQLNFKSSDGKSLWCHNQEKCRRALGVYIIMDEVPFRSVERDGFKYFVNELNPQFEIPSRYTIARDILQIYYEERAKLKILIRENCERISLTTDTWTSNQHLNYMTLSAHFIDPKWKLHRYILCFRPVDGHTGDDIGRALERCIREWGIEKVFTITVDNATYNGKAIRWVREKMDVWKTNILGGKYLHMRCVAHIINLVVKDGLNEEIECIDAIRGVVKYIRGSPSRYQKFRKFIETEGIESKKCLALDVPNRWNSTYEMLEGAISLERAIVAYELRDDSIRKELEKSYNGVPTYFHWEKAKVMHKFLKLFYDFTVALSGSQYVTCNTVFIEISQIEKCLHSYIKSYDVELRNMAIMMKSKFDQYWGSMDSMNNVIIYGNVLDPRSKLRFVEFAFDNLYFNNPIKCANMKASVREGLYELFDVYKSMSFEHSQSSSTPSTSSSTSSCNVGGLGDSNDIWGAFSVTLNDNECVQVMSEMDIYLKDSVVRLQPGEKFDILNWWSINCLRYPILSMMARDLYCVPVSTVAFESSFSTAGRVLDPFRSSLLPKTVEALICTQDWLRGFNRLQVIEEDPETVDMLEKEFTKIIISGSINQT